MSQPLYSPQNPMKLEPYYSRHVNAMTEEQLHSKSAIAEQLAARDKKIDELLAGPPWLAEAAEALGQVQPDGKPLALNWTQVLEEIRRLRTEEEESKATVKRLSVAMEEIAFGLGCDASKVQILLTLKETLASSARAAELALKAREEAEERIQELEQDIRTGLRIAHQLTEETQTVEEACTDLVRLVREARKTRDERDAKIAEMVRELTAEKERHERR